MSTYKSYSLSRSGVTDGSSGTDFGTLDSRAGPAYQVSGHFELNLKVFKPHLDGCWHYRLQDCCDQSVSTGKSIACLMNFQLNTLTLNRFRGTLHYTLSRTFRILELKTDSKIWNLFCFSSNKGVIGGTQVFWSVLSGELRRCPKNFCSGNSNPSVPLRDTKNCTSLMDR